MYFLKILCNKYINGCNNNLVETLCKNLPRRSLINVILISDDYIVPVLEVKDNTRTVSLR